MDLKNHAKGLKEKGIDLDKPGGGAVGRLQVEGTFLFAPVAFERYQSSGKGTPALMFRMVVLEGEYAGNVIDVDMYLVGEMFDLGTFALCMGHPEEPFNEKDDAAIEAMITQYYTAIIGKVMAEQYNGKTNYKVKYWSKAPPDKRTQEFAEQDGPQGIFNAAVDGWNNYLEWRAKNPRKAPGSANGQGGGQPNGRATVSRSSASGGDDIPENDADIPF